MVRTLAFEHKPQLHPVTPDLIAAKNDLRRQMRARIAALSDQEMSAASARLCEQLRTAELGRTVALFGGIAGEPNLLPLIPWLIEGGARPVFFGFADGMLVPQIASSAAELERGVFGVWTPLAHAPVIDVAELDTILVPGLAFDTHGHRLGRGRGYFDRLFADPNVKAQRIGVCLDCQVVPAVPVEAHDAVMHALVTPSVATQLVR
jgi:5-formyltetrahydrofolate cyclo-ligase